MPTPEGDVLKPVDASTNPDEWQIFALSNAYVVHEKNGKPASLLAAYADTPLKVVGTFAPGRGQAKYLQNKLSKPTEIEIRNVTKFSYGELTDGEIVIWAEGKAGWFEIQPAPHYTEIHNGIIEAVQLLYFVTDIYNEPRKRGGGPSAQLVFQEYAEDERFTCTDPLIAEQIFDRHLVFLMMCFLNRAQGIGWSNTPLYQYLRRRHPKVFDACKARREGRYAQMLPERQARNNKQPPVSAPAPPAATNAKIIRGKVASPKPVEAPKKDDNWWGAATLFEFMQKAVNQRVLRAGRSQITLERVAQLIIRRYEIEELETAQNVLLVHASNLCYMMDHPRRKNIRYFADEPIYRELAAGHNLSAAEQRRAEGVELRPRRDHGTLKDDDTESSNTSSEEDDVVATPVRRPPGRQKRGRLSVLRPSSKFSGKSKGIKHAKMGGGKGKAPVPASEASDASEAEDGDEANGSEKEDMVIDTPTQAQSPSREKRKLDQTSTEDKEERTRRKRAASASITPDSPPTTIESEDEITLPDGTVPPIPLRYLPSASRPTSSSHSKAPIAPSLISTPLPTYTPNGPRDSWICNFDGCSQRIYGCSKDLGRRLITEHLEDHAQGRDKVVGILWREQDKLHLPVSNLIRKIREMSEASTPLFPGAAGESVLSQPIHRPV
ncbi:hypothetical protein BDU57DRAFT_467007 [Ampelomyces quisqualis]|uniref:DNA (cytosine-5)-methyltransferase 1 replication foci domain-containing protein n=1 Tax=Ampelomyces quisqualis TaxID=50730 RepID=A0A6A5R262_AMPQU|nr:hypothetical protein BDU57DRAFT_467007 [Ampelomyces quisqualis]